MSITLSALQKQRRDTAANWTGANPTLLAGEIGIESDTNKIKIGDGSTAWTSLGYRPWSQVSAYPLVNADIAAAAAIAYSKLATLTSGNVVLGSSVNVATSTAVTGDVTISNTGVTAIASDVIVDADINASAAIAGSKIVAATTSVVGAVQLSDSTSTTSSILAATPTAVKAAFDLATAALPKAGGTLTGDVILDNQVDARFREATANGTNYVGFQAPASVPADVLWTLPNADAAVSGYALVSNASGTLSWAAAGGGDVTLTGTETLTNKTLTAPIINGTISGTALASTSDVNGVNTTGTVTASTTSLVVASATGIAAGMFVVGEGIAPGTTVSSIASTTVTLSANANTTLSAAPVTFYSASKVLTPAVVGSQLCRAWVNFNGTGTVAIRASFNVSSITDNGTGDYTVNFTTALVDANYATQVMGGRSSNDLSVAANGYISSQAAPTTSTIRIRTNNPAVAYTDYDYIGVAIFR